MSKIINLDDSFSSLSELADQIESGNIQIPAELIPKGLTASQFARLIRINFPVGIEVPTKEKSGKENSK